MKVMKTMNVVIDDPLDSGSEKVEEFPKEILPPKPKEVPEIVEQELASPSTPSVMEDSADIPTSPEFESHEEKGPSSKIKLNHPPEVIVGNMNELTLRKRTVDKYVANFMSYSCYLLLIPLKLRKLFRMKARLKQCMMNCFNFRGMMSGL